MLVIKVYFSKLKKKKGAKNIYNMYDGFPRFFSLTLKSARMTTDQNKQMFFKRYSWIKAKQQQKYRNLNGIQI